MSSRDIDERLELIKDLEFIIEEEMKETIFEMLAIQQMIGNEELSKREIKMLEKHKLELIDKFCIKKHIAIAIHLYHLLCLFEELSCLNACSNNIL